MNNIEYRVRPGDTLSAIAHHHDVPVDVLARLNHIKNIHLLWVGQALRIPKQGAAAAPAPSSAPSHTHVVLEGETLSGIARRYGVSLHELVSLNGIEDADRIDTGQVLRLPSTEAHPVKVVAHPRAPAKSPPRSSSSPSTSPAAATPHASTGLDLKALARAVHDAMFAYENVWGANETDEEGVYAALARLRHDPALIKQFKQVYKAAYRTELEADLRAEFSNSWVLGQELDRALSYLKPLQKTPAPAPAPKSGTGPRIKDEDNLVLGPNEDYREAILVACRHTGLSPQVLATLINAEARQDKQLRWVAESRNPHGAAGLTQFLAGTWVELACNEQSFLHPHARDRGLIQPILHKKTKKIIGWQKESSRERELLDLRLDAKMSARAAAETAVWNLKEFHRKFTVPASVTSSDLARIAYLCHHEGMSGAVKFARKQDSHTLSKFKKQTGEKQLKKYLADNGQDVTRAYRAWLADYVNKKIVPGHFARDSTQFPAPRPLQVILADLSPGSTHPAPKTPTKTPTAPTPSPGTPAPPKPQSGLDLHLIALHVHEALFSASTLGFHDTDEQKVYDNLARLNHDAALISQFKAVYVKAYGAAVETHIAAEMSDSVLFGDEKSRALSYLQPRTGKQEGAPKEGAPKGPHPASHLKVAEGIFVDTGHKVLQTLAKAKLFTGEDASCVTTVRRNMQALKLSTYGTTGDDLNNSRGAMVQLLKMGWESVPFPGSELRTIKSCKAYGEAQAHVCEGPVIQKLADAKKLPLGALIIQTMHGWTYGGGYRGNDVGILHEYEGQITTFNYKEMEHVLIYKRMRKELHITKEEEVVVLVPKGALLRD